MSHSALIEMLVRKSVQLNVNPYLTFAAINEHFKNSLAIGLGIAPRRMLLTLIRIQLIAMFLIDKKGHYNHDLDHKAERHKTDLKPMDENEIFNLIQATSNEQLAFLMESYETLNHSYVEAVLFANNVILETQNNFNQHDIYKLVTSKFKAEIEAMSELAEMLCEFSSAETLLTTIKSLN